MNIESIAVRRWLVPRVVFILFQEILKQVKGPTNKQTSILYSREVFVLIFWTYFLNIKIQRTNNNIGFMSKLEPIYMLGKVLGNVWDVWDVCRHLI